MIWSKLGITNPEIVDVENPLDREFASDYVQNVMALNPLFPVENIENIKQNDKQLKKTTAIIHSNITKQTPRKRQLSDDSENTEPCKKVKPDNIDHPPSNEQTYTNNLLIDMISKLSLNVESMGTRLEKRISDMESNMERKLTVKFNTVITDRVKEEVGKAKKDIQKEMKVIKENIEKLDKTYADIGSTRKENITPDNKTISKTFKIVVKNLPVDQRENSGNTVLKAKVEALVKDGLKLKDVNIRKVTRMLSQNYSDNTTARPGIVFVELNTIEHKRLILKSKRQLKDNFKYKTVYIENDLPREKRMADFNNRKLLKALGREKDFKTIGGRITKKQNIINTDEVNTNNIEGQRYNRPPINNRRGNNEHYGGYRRHNAHTGGPKGY
ncbi:Hypothetical predicted protein [Mytilus galloprovincialis]|uniref:Uncharacterized protein n=1 Tax=Mytilus galloprovincialis TaxID=29158 RepID=A0A8B6FNJ6_MYTGA|nr:Hypothetical predicted protein [Mytilus galloprovincialis]